MTSEQKNAGILRSRLSWLVARIKLGAVSKDARLAHYCNRLMAIARGASPSSFTRAKPALVQDDIATLKRSSSAV